MALPTLPNLLDNKSQRHRQFDEEVDSDADPRLFPGKDADETAVGHFRGLPNQRSAMLSSQEALGEYHRYGILGPTHTKDEADGLHMQEGLPCWRRVLIRASYYIHVNNGFVKRLADKAPVSLANLSVVAGCGTMICSIANVIGFFLGQVNVSSCILNVYSLLFGAVTVLLEMDVDALPASPALQDVVLHVSQSQKFLRLKVQLLTDFLGRAVFYTYQGAVLMSQGCTHSLLFIIGLFNVFVGLLCAWMAWDSSWNASSDGVASSAGTTFQSKHVFDPEPVFGALPDYDFQAAKRAYEREEKGIKGQLQMDLYALLQQAEIGDCASKRPGGLMNSCAKAKWDAWNQLRGMTPSAAKAAFVERLAGGGIQA